MNTQTVTVFEAREDDALREAFIKQHFPFIIHTTSSIVGRYIAIENDEEFSVALEAFNIAIDLYDASMSKFETYATTVIKNKLIDYHRKQRKHYGQEELSEDITAPENDDTLRVEIADLSQKLKAFGMSFSDLIRLSPKHQDTRKNAIRVGVTSSKHKNIVEALYQSRKLPVALILKVVETTRRFVYAHSRYITSVMVIFTEELNSLQTWILDMIKDDEHGSSKS